MQVRISRLSELKALTEIYNEQVVNGVATFDTEPASAEERRAWFEQHKNPKYPLVSAVDEGSVLGWGSLSPFHPRPAYNPTAEFSVYVHKDYRAMGVGKEILSDLLRRARLTGFHSLIGLITGENTPSLCLARSFGFREVGRFQEVGRKFERWLDVVVVQLLL